MSFEIDRTDPRSIMKRYDEILQYADDHSWIHRHASINPISGLYTIHSEGIAPERLWDKNIELVTLYLGKRYYEQLS
jgi:hypothetical protein